MSAFLGPIHFWLYNKIQIQQELVEDIIILSNEQNDKELDLKKELDRRYGISETRPLQEIIDEDNIHGFLQTLVAQVEYKLAYGITILLNKNSNLKNEIELIFERKGKEKSLSEVTNNALDTYQAIQDILLDGMPCDNANHVIKENEDMVVWERNTCVHKRYWDEVSGDVSNYYFFREAFIRGLLSNTKMKFEKIDEVTFSIERSNNIE